MLAARNGIAELLLGCRFAYGQSGCGKSYSVVGDPPNLGIIPRTVKAVFEVVDGNTDPDVRYAVPWLKFAKFRLLPERRTSTVRRQVCVAAGTEVCQPRNLRKREFSHIERMPERTDQLSR